MPMSETLLELVKSFPTLKKGMGGYGASMEEFTFILRLQVELYNEGSVGADNPFWDSPEAEGMKPDDPRSLLVWLDGDFGKWTHEAVQYFQSRHVDPDGNYLEVDGVVGQNTWWALYSRYADREIPEPVAAEEPTDVSGSTRKKVLDKAFSFLGAKEVPNGSNCGPEVNLFNGGAKRWAWCAMFTHYVYKQVVGHDYVKTTGEGRPDPDPSCWWTTKYAKEQGIFVPKGEGDPIPGDIYSLNFGGGGHYGFVTHVNRDSSGKVVSFGTISGNESNRVKEGTRSINTKSLVGFVRPYAEDDVLENYDKADKNAKDSSGDATR